MPTGGSIQSIKIDGTEFAVTADNDATVMRGGYSSEHQPNGDNASARKILTSKLWKITGLQLSIDFSSADDTLLQNIANNTTDVAISIRLADDSERAGTGNIEGDMTFSTQSSTVSLDLAGPGDLT